jgi:hypothetical protein
MLIYVSPLKLCLLCCSQKVGNIILSWANSSDGGEAGRGEWSVMSIVGRRFGKCRTIPCIANNV